MSAHKSNNERVKKVNRWSCKLCGEKQSLLKEFGRGSGADCRRHVQKLNAMRGAVMEEQDTWSLWKQTEEKPEKPRDDQVSSAQVSSAQVSRTQVSRTQVSRTQVSRTQVSRWSKYLDTPEEEEEEEEPEEDVLMDRQHLHGNNRKRKRTDGSSTPEQADRFSRAGPSPGCSRTASLSAVCQVKEGAGSTVSGWSDTTDKAPPLNKPHPLLHVSSMFESGDDFSFDF